MRISEHFTLDELTHSEYAARTGVANKPGPDELANLCRLAQKLEEVRTLIGKPLIINSAYRSQAVNAAIGGAHNSQHMRGLAADIRVGGMTAYEVCQRILRSGIELDQCILEYGSWSHISIPEIGQAPRGMFLTYRTGKPASQGIAA